MVLRLIAPGLTERWSTPEFHPHADGWAVTRDFQVVGVYTPTAAKDLVQTIIRLNDPHPENPLCLAKDFDVVTRGFGAYDVRVLYQSSPLGRFPDPSNPLADPTYWSWEDCQETVTADRDAYGNPIVMSNGDAPPMGSVTKQVGYLQLWAERNEPVYNPKTWVTYGNRVNAAQMSLCGKWTIEPGMMALISYKQLAKVTKFSTYVPVRYTFKLVGPAPTSTAPDASDGLWDSFKARLLDQGFNGFYTLAGTATRGKITGQTASGTNDPVSVEVRLDGTGKPVDSTLKVMGKTPQANPKALPANVEKETTGDATWLKYTLLPPVDFGDLAL